MQKDVFGVHMKNLQIVAIVFCFLSLFGCVEQNMNFDLDKIISEQNQTVTSEKDILTIADTTAFLKNTQLSQVKKFDNFEHFKQYITQNTNLMQPTQTFDGSLSNSVESSAKTLSAPLATLGLTDAQSVVSSVDHSTTNVQVVGVDEADFVKTDGKYIYMVKNSNLIIIDAQTTNIVFEQKLLSEQNNLYNYYSDGTQQLYVNKNRLAIFSTIQKEQFYFEKYDINPQRTYRSYTLLYVFDVSNPSNPTLLTNISVSGNYYQSRMIDDIIYFVSNEYVQNDMNPPILNVADLQIYTDIYYFENPEQSYSLNTITSFDLNSNNILDSKTYLMGQSNTLMMSQNYLYIAYSKNQNWCSWCYGQQSYQKERFDEIILPMLPSEVVNQIEKIKTQKLDEEQTWQKISEQLQSYFEPAYLTNSGYSQEIIRQRKELYENIQDKLAQYDALLEIERSSTSIHKFSIENGKINHVAQGAVHGKLLNQFSMDEYDSNLRLATTIDVYAQKRIQYNNVYVLDSNLNTVGRIEKIAKDEKIYSSRFMGDKLYLVTYKQMDPFFVIDLSNPKEPAVLGELKIPGYSSYLHPYDQNIIIGIGKQTEQNSWGGVETKGVKISLFNVQDLQKPKEIDYMEFGSSGSDSAVLYDHKAFLLDKSKGLLVLPLKVVQTQESFFRDKTNVWDGAVVINITKDGFEEYGTVKHSQSESFYGGWLSESTVKRSLYIEDRLYTISDKYLKVNNISENMPEISSITISKKSEQDQDVFSAIKVPFIN